MKKYLLEFVVFSCGAVVMILELAASRILAPHVGVSIVVWTSLIGIVLASLSLGYYLGGNIADRNNPRRALPFVLLISSIFVISILILQPLIVPFIALLKLGIGIQSVVIAVLLFSVPGVFLGMISPIAVKLKLSKIKKSGAVVGNLYALSTIGSITGTFLAGFVLLALFSVTNIILGLGVFLFILFLLTSDRGIFRVSLVFVAVFVAAILLQNSINKNEKVFESMYNHMRLYTIGKGSKEALVMQLDNKWDSAMYLNSDELVFDYSKYYRLAKKINPDMKNVLMVGGGAYSVPKDFLRLYKDINMDVVEIDPFLTTIAKKYFRLKDDPRLAIYHEDGRTFLNREVKNGTKKYDVILMDAFKSFSIPFHLTTREAVGEMHSLLGENGVVIVNIISKIEGEGGGFLQAEYHTYKEFFPQVYVLPVDSSRGDAFQNIMMIALKGKTNASDVLSANLWRDPIKVRPVLTDDFAPVDQYVIRNNM